MQHATRLGLTGGIGSGKSTVAQLLQQLGAAVIDADAISRATTAVGGQAIESIQQRFGPDFIGPEGALDRGKMRALVYVDALARQALETIVHPLVQQETDRQATAAVQSGKLCIVFDVPLLAESRHWRARVDLVLVVDCPPEVQISRVMARSGLARAEIENIMASQARREQRLRTADVVIFNGALTLAELAVEVQQISHRFGL
jgi:dephospho-CoA kinase